VVEKKGKAEVMGGLSSRYRNLGEEAWQFNNSDDISVSAFQTGDIVLFAEDFPTSSLHRMTRRMRNQLWSNCGIVVKVPGLWQNQTMLLEAAAVHPDDHIRSKCELKTVESGVRLINLMDRLRAQNFSAIGIRRRKRVPELTIDETENLDTFNPFNQWQTMTRLKPLLAGNLTRPLTEKDGALEALKALKIVHTPYVKLTLNDLAGSTLNRYCDSYNEYTKNQISVWPTDKAQRMKDVLLQ